jgi:hypothetical protein
MPPKLTALDDTQPSIAASLRKLLDRIAAGQDISDQVTPEFAKIINPETTKAVQKLVSPLWPGGTLTLVRRGPAPNDPSGTLSIFRLTKGDQKLLVFYRLTPDGKVAALLFQPNRETL